MNIVVRTVGQLLKNHGSLLCLRVYGFDSAFIYLHAPALLLYLKFLEIITKGFLEIQG